jgi:hypothetical protein
MREETSASIYFECSAKTGQGCGEVMTAVIATFLNHDKGYETYTKKQSKGLFSRVFRD